MAAFVPATVACFLSFPPRKALLVSLMTGWLFLPAGVVYEVVAPLTSKPSFVSGVILVVSLVLDWKRWRELRLSAFDLPVAVLSFVPFATAMANGMDVREATSAMAGGFVVYGAPYALGRAYFGGLRQLSDFASALAIAGAVYVPFCLFEVRMSPNLHYWVFGFETSDFGQGVRGGSYRPTVFMRHGLMLALLIASATLVAYWLWRSGRPRQLLRVSMNWIVLALGFTSLLLRSAGAQVLLLAGIVSLEATRQLRTRVLILALLLAPSVYCSARLLGWRPTPLVDLASTIISLERADSFLFRVRNEDLLIAKALERPLLGWGRWGRGLVYDESGRNISVPDGLWVLVLGSSGLVGLLAFALTYALPVATFLRRFPARAWSHPLVAPAAALAVVVLLWMADCVPNAMMNPLFTVMAGGLMGLEISRKTAGGRARATSLGRTAPGGRRPSSRSPSFGTLP